MGLTEEQQERIRKNRERALEIRKRKLEEEAKKKQESIGDSRNDIKAAKKPKTESKVEKEEEEVVELEAFEEGASEYVTKQEAMKMYCLPAGTLAVCKVTEKPNPRNSSWSSMKLYERAEIRRRARKRFGGLDGLVAERKKREEKRMRDDMERTKDVFR